MIRHTVSVLDDCVVAYFDPPVVLLPGEELHLLLDAVPDFPPLKYLATKPETLTRYVWTAPAVVAAVKSVVAPEDW